MAKSKLKQTNDRIARACTGLYGKIESAVVGEYTRVEDAFVDRYLTREGETVEEAKKRLRHQGQ